MNTTTWFAIRRYDYDNAISKSRSEESSRGAPRKTRPIEDVIQLLTRAKPTKSKYQNDLDYNPWRRKTIRQIQRSTQSS